jgi:hypothetical protein
MASLFAYTKVSDQFTTYFLKAEKLQELGRLSNGKTVVSVDGALDQDQFEQITDIEQLPADGGAFRAEISGMRAFALIDEQTVAAIRSQYSIDDEMKLLRTRSEPQWTEYNDFVESCRDEGRAKKQALGLA